MAQPPGTTDDLQTPQDRPAVVDLTSRGEQCAIGKRNPSWCQNADQNGTTTLPYPDTAPCTVPSGGQILPDNAFSSTTVTLSYVSRSHVFSTQDSLSGNSSLYGVPTFSKYSLQPSCKLGKTGIALNQSYLENVDGPSHLAAHTDLLQSLSQAQLDLNIDANRKQTYVLNGASQLDTSEHHVDNYEHVHNGENIWLNENLPDGAMSSPECPTDLQESDGSNSSSRKTDHFGDIHFLQNSPTVPKEFLQSVQCSDTLKEHFTSSFNSRQEVPESLHGSLELMSKEGRKGPEKSQKPSEESCSPLGECNQECQETGNSFDSLRKHTEDILYRDSPEAVCASSTVKAVTKQLGNVISPPEDPASPSATSTFFDETDLVFVLPEASSSPRGRNSFFKITSDLPSIQDTIQPGSEDNTTSLLSNDVNNCSRKKSVLEPLIDLTDDVCIKKAKVLNGNTKQNMKERKLPARSGRGMRLESIVMNINSSRYNVSGCLQTGKKSPQMNEVKVRPHKSYRRSRNKKRDNKKGKTEVSPKKGHNKASPANCKKSTSDLYCQSATIKSCKALQVSPVKLKRKCSLGHTPPSENSQELSLSLMDSTVDVTEGSISSIPESPKSSLKRQRKTNNETSTNKARPRAKLKSTPRKKRKKLQIGNASSMFSPKEPEIKLRYLNYKEEKRELKTDGFSPFIWVQRKEQVPSLCTVVNYPEELKTPLKSNQKQGASAMYVSTLVPTTSCLRLGRVSMQGDQQKALVCCLCGQSANAMDLGDLHGPYYSEGHQPPAKGSKGQGLKGEEESSDSDSSSCSSSRKWSSIKEGGRSLATKHARTDVEDWYSPPVVPLGPCEYWFHEDCGVWSAGVFLVRSKVYGLEEAVRAAQSTKCLSCEDRGASLGCLFKGCPNKYHYRCALRSDCVLEEENFSMKCRKHKNKSMVTPRSSRAEPR